MTDPREWGVAEHYSSYDGQLVTAPAATVNAILNVMGATEEATRPPGPWVLRSGDTREVSSDWHIVFEDGSELSGPPGPMGSLLPLGYHQMWLDGRPQRLIVAPAQCAPVPDANPWGWALQLYSARSSTSWGMGDLADLARFGRLSQDLGANLALINPLHAALVGEPQQTSPYFPSSRSFYNPIYIAVEEVSGAKDIEEVTAAANAGRGLNKDRLIDRDQVWRLKETALEAIWLKLAPRREVDEFIGQRGKALFDYATFCVLVETHGRLWRQWPFELRHPSSDAVGDFAQTHLDRVRFHAWLQMLMTQQLQTAAASVDLVCDLAIGVDPGGADAWLWQDAMALDMRVGAPPDEFNTLGQNWSLPPFDPWRLQGLDYEPFIQTIRANLASTRGLRIDHVMGLFRLFWIPAGESPQQGTYVRYPSEDLLAIVALESQRAGAFVVGEDLGTVEDGVRERLAEANMLSYKLMLFEPEPPSRYPSGCMAAFTTHDLPTVEGLWSGRDLEIQHQLELAPNEAATKAIKDRLDDWTAGLDQPISAAVHSLLADCSAGVVTATVEDSLGVSERPNYPGTTTEWPNWSQALPVLLDELAAHPGFTGLSQILKNGRNPTHNRSDEAS